MHRRLIQTSRHSSCCLVWGDWPVLWKLKNVINLCAIFDVGIDAMCTSNAVHKVPGLQHSGTQTLDQVCARAFIYMKLRVQMGSFIGEKGRT